MDSEILDFIRGFFGSEIFDADAPLIDLVPLDSVRVMEMVIFLEQKYGVCIPAEEILRKNFLTAKTMSILVSRLSLKCG